MALDDEPGTSNDPGGYGLTDDISDDALDTLAGGQDSTALATKASHEPPGPAF